MINKVLLQIHTYLYVKAIDLKTQRIIQTHHMYDLCVNVNHKLIFSP